MSDLSDKVFAARKIINELLLAIPAEANERSKDSRVKTLKRPDAAKFIGCSSDKLNRMTKDGTLKGCYYRVGSRVIYLQDKLTEWMLNGGTEEP